MPITAKASKRYTWRLALIAVFFLGCSAWFEYDGMVAYPNQQLRANEYERLEKENEELGKGERLSAFDFKAMWEEYAAERGWPQEKPDEAKTDGDIFSQKVLGGVVFVPGVFCVFYYFSFRRRWIELNETGLRTSGGQSLEFDQILTLDKQQWKKKGIARIRYQKGPFKRRLVLDDWKFDDKPIKAILLEVESHIDPQQIVGGPPETISQEEASPSQEQARESDEETKPS